METDRPTPATIPAYISQQPEALHPILNKVYETIRAAAPKATERIAYRMPTFWQGENLIHFAAMKNHLGIYPGDLSALTPFAEKLKEYTTTKGAIHFPYNKPIDYGFIAELTRFRVNAARIKAESKKK
jgi:uncharacterized protein YdhG (YjbR/CyaY superfamily)